MKRLAFFLAATAFASPAAAQHEHHETGGPPPADTLADDPHAHHRMAEPDPNAAHRSQEADPEAGHGTPSAQPAGDPHAGHGVEETDPHSGHEMGHTAVDPPLGPPGPAAFSGPEHAADAYFDEGAMARARVEMSRMHGAVPTYGVLVDRLEAEVQDGRDAYSLDAQAWYGGDLDKAWLKVDADRDFGGPFESAELQALWSHAIGPFFDLQTGVRFDAGHGPDRAHVVLGVQGLAPYWIEIDAAAFLSDKGDITAKVEAEHDALITQRLILQPRVEAQFSLEDIPDLEIGSGLTDFSAGIRLRYQVVPLFAPYVGIEYERSFGETRRLRRAAGEEAGGLGFVAGVRFWF